MSDNQIKAITIGSALGTTAGVIFGDIVMGITFGTTVGVLMSSFILNEKNDK